MPFPPESGRNSFLHIITGPACSVASIGIVMTPDGNAVALNPSSSGLAPEPPELNVKTSERFAFLLSELSLAGRRET